jgi:hypothetical protein
MTTVLQTDFLGVNQMSKDHGNCPHCGADLNGGSIWEHFYNEFQNKGYWLDADGKYSNERRILTADEAALEADKVARNYGATRTEGQWGREIGEYSMEKDRTVSWSCPDCGGKWPR